MISIYKSTEYYSLLFLVEKQTKKGKLKDPVRFYPGPTRYC